MKTCFREVPVKYFDACSKREAKNISEIGPFFDYFLHFSNHFSYRFKTFRGAISFCRRAAVK